MKYKIEFKPQAIKDCKKIPKREVQKIFEKIDKMSNALQGDVKQLTNFTHEYRLRVGDYRVLFEIEKKIIYIYRIRHRKQAYK